MTRYDVLIQSPIFKIQLTTRTADFFVVSKMSVDLVGFVILVGLVYQDTRRLHYSVIPSKTEVLQTPSAIEVNLGQGVE